MAFQKLPSIEYLRQILTYDPVNGWLIWNRRSADLFTWPRICNSWNAKYAGTRAGALANDGYRKLTIKYKTYLEHRVIFSLVHGIDIENEIDHINCDRADNRIENLRLATKSEQCVNNSGQKRRRSQYKGAYINSVKSQRKFRSSISFGGKTFYLGVFETAEDAHAAYCAAGMKLHGEFFNDGLSRERNDSDGGNDEYEKSHAR